MTNAHEHKRQEEKTYIGKEQKIEEEYLDSQKYL